MWVCTMMASQTEISPEPIHWDMSNQNGSNSAQAGGLRAVQSYKNRADSWIAS